MSTVRRGGRARNKRRQLFATFAMTLCVALLLVGGPAGADESNASDDPVAKLHDYMQELAARQSVAAHDVDVQPASSGSIGAAADDGVFASLHAYVQRIHGDPSRSDGKSVKVAGADNAARVSAKAQRVARAAGNAQAACDHAGTTGSRRVLAGTRSDSRRIASLSGLALGSDRGVRLYGNGPAAEAGQARL